MFERIPEMLRDLPGCHVVPVRDTQSLASRLLVSATTEDEMWSHQRYEAARKYSPGAVAQQTLDVYREVAGIPAARWARKRNHLVEGMNLVHE